MVAEELSIVGVRHQWPVFNHPAV